MHVPTMERCKDASCRDRDPSDFQSCPVPPPDRRELGRASWTFLHSVSANAPAKMSRAQGKKFDTWMKAFSSLYPCSTCRPGFERQVAAHRRPAVRGREEFVLWMGQFHNLINKEIGAPEHSVEVSDVLRIYADPACVTNFEA
eukprot:Polyplicarium_translucidae@DN3173_c0_g1_i7.p3